MSDYTTRSAKHYDRMSHLNAELRGVIEAVGRMVDVGGMTAEQALTEIRRKADKTSAEINASWDELLGGEPR